MATAGTKLTRVLSRFFINNVNNKPWRVMGSGSSFNGLAKYSTAASTAVKDYEDYRKSLYGDISHRALLVDAVGTLVVPSQPMAQIYRQIGEKYGVEYSEDEILNRYRWAYGQPWGRSRLRYVNDGRPFWQFIVSSSTGCSDARYFEELYSYYTTEKAWHLCDPDAEKVFEAIRKAGVKLAVVSNFDTRLRPLLRALNCDHWFDAVAVSAEVRKSHTQRHASNYSHFLSL
ncbi:hypothetical protein H0E87_013472 [Populus deltoides]|uniref:Haloacid dehalogenase-like hydrolase superfamily protein n=1 Tax=Populus deltoides TaxID=3696 RepID=A0A8T2YNF9_POPDE|nr:hypothetical protein H0E87_013472 [Populus deltoides]